MIKRDEYLNQLISKRENGQVKIITGIRQCGKSSLLFGLYKNYLNSQGIDDAHIIQFQLGKEEFDDYRTPKNLYEHILQNINETDQFYIFIGNIQLCDRVKKRRKTTPLIPKRKRRNFYATFYDILNEFMSRKNLDIYITGSNTKLLSNPAATNLRENGCEIRMYPLSFKEYYEYVGLEKTEAWEEYMTYGGMPYVAIEKNEEKRAEYLKSLFSKFYIKDIMESYKMKNEFTFSNLIDVLLSSVSTLSDPHKMNRILTSERHLNMTDCTIKKYLDHLEDFFMHKKIYRLGLKRELFLDYPMKYYVADVGLRNARLNFTQQNKSLIMENIIFNELISRGYSVDAAVIQYYLFGEGISTKINIEIDFILNQDSDRVYVQTAFDINDPEKKEEAIKPLLNSGDFCKKILVVSGNQERYQDENGIIIIGAIPFLLDKDSVEKL